MFSIFQHCYTLLICWIVIIHAIEENEFKSYRRNEDRDWLSLCKCARPALRQMQGVLAEYSSHVTDSDPPPLDDVIDKIKEIAYNCTKLPQCRCPDGYFKTRDGYNCLKISEEEVNCDKAMSICAQDVNARLAVAKDHRRLTKLADYIREVDPTDQNFYWIGLSYNRTNGGIPVWTWEDGSLASYDITRKLRNKVKKSLLRIIDVTDGSSQAIERVAISKDYQGAHWKQEACGTSIRGNPVTKHKYICEFVMFKVEIKAVTSTPVSSNAGRNLAIGRAGLSQ